MEVSDLINSFTTPMTHEAACKEYEAAMKQADKAFDPKAFLSQALSNVNARETERQRKEYEENRRAEVEALDWLETKWRDFYNFCITGPAILQFVTYDTDDNIANFNAKNTLVGDFQISIASNSLYIESFAIYEQANIEWKLAQLAKRESPRQPDLPTETTPQPRMMYRAQYFNDERQIHTWLNEQWLDGYELHHMTASPCDGMTGYCVIVKDRCLLPNSTADMLLRSARMGAM